MNKLEIKQLHASINDKPILKGVELEVATGQIHALMGPNGAGKSTLASVLAGHPSYQITKGQVLLDKRDLLKMSPDERAQAGIFLAFQYPVEVPGVRVLQFLWEAYKIRKQANKITSILDFRNYLEKLADELQMSKDLLKRGLNEGFSGGEKKRLEVLQMAVLKPKFAILDETDSGLDIDAIKVVAAGVKKVVKRFKTGVLIITHYQRILNYLKPDFVHVMKDGKIVESGDGKLAYSLEKKGYHK